MGKHQPGRQMPLANVLGRMSGHSTVDPKGMILKVHFIVKVHVTNPAPDLVAVPQMQQVLSPEILVQIARGIEFVNEFVNAMVRRFQGQYHPNANKTSPQPLLFTINENGQCSDMQRAVRGRFACVERLRWFSRSSAVYSITYGTTLLYEAIRGDCVDGIIPPPVITLKRGIIWSSKRFDQSLLGWTLRRAGNVDNHIFESPGPKASAQYQLPPDFQSIPP